MSYQLPVASYQLPQRHARVGAAMAGIALLMAGPLLGQGIRVNVNRTEATVEDQLLLTVTVEGSQFARPQLPELPGFHVHSAGSSRNLQIINGQMTSSVAYSYLLTPKSTGNLTIGPATVEIDGQTYRSRPFEVSILDAASQPRESRELFLTAMVSNREPHVGEQVLYTWRFYRRVQVAGARLQPQQFDGVVVEDLGEVREYQTTVGGLQYLVSEIRKALFPQEEGALILPGSQLQCEVPVQRRPRRRGSLFDDFFGRVETETKILRTQPIELAVQPLPPPPASFTGLVGKFDIQGKISKQELQAGESATFELTVSGTGNVQMISEPPLPDFAGFKVYGDKPTGSIDRSGSRLTGSKSFHKALVPLEAGELIIPAVELAYFDPKEETYRTASTLPLVLRVAPASGEEELRLTEFVAPTTGKVAVKILADDILPIHKGLDAVSPQRLNGPVGALWMGGLVAPPLLFVALLLVRRRQERFESDADLRRRRTALKKALSTLRRIDAEARKGRGAPAQLASRCLREYVGDKLGVEGNALTAAETDAVLRRHGVGEALVRETHELLERLEAAQYGAPSGGSHSAKPGETLRPLLRRLDRQIRA